MTPKQDPLETLDESHLRWTAVEAKAPKSEPMRRITSRSSNTSSKHRHSKASSKKNQQRVHPLLSQASQMSHLEMTGNASTYHESPMAMNRMMDVQQYLATQDLDTLSVSSQATGPYYPSMMAMDADALQYASGDLSAAMSQQHVNPQVFQSGLPGHSPQSWTSLSPVGSRFSSPQAPEGLPDDTWSTLPLESSPPESYIDSTSPPMLPSQSSRYVVAEELDGLSMSNTLVASRSTSGPVSPKDLRGAPTLNDDAYVGNSGFSSRRSSGEGESARDHYLYKNAYPQADNLFHCPWEGQASCSHKPEKLKCNYE